MVGKEKHKEKIKIILNIKYGKYYNELSVRDYLLIRFYQFQLLIRKIQRWIIMVLKEWFNITFIISTIAVLVYFLLAYYIGNYYKGYGLRKTLWDNRNILFTFLVASNLIKFTVNTNKRKGNLARRHDMYTELYCSFVYIVGRFFKENLGLDYKDGCLYTKDELEDKKTK